MAMADTTLTGSTYTASWEEEERIDIDDLLGMTDQIIAIRNGWADPINPLEEETICYIWMCEK